MVVRAPFSRSEMADGVVSCMKANCFDAAPFTKTGDFVDFLSSGKSLKLVEGIETMRWLQSILNVRR